MTLEIPDSPVELEDVEEQYDEAMARCAEQDFRFRSMSYEEGVKATLAWIMGDTDSKPMED